MLEKVKNNLKDKKVDIVNVIERLSAHPGLPTALIWFPFFLFSLEGRAD